MIPFISWCALGFVSGVVYASFFEWFLHRFAMHRPIGKFDYPYRAHALTHHRIFKADPSYHLQDETDRHLVPMAWWNGPVLIALTQLPFVFIAYFLNNWPLLIGSFTAGSLYYATYEYLHYCMHVPRTRAVERSGIFFRLNGHHLLHHRYMGKNFNVVLPLADLCLGTLLPRAKVAFAQAKGPQVPDVQPRENNNNYKVAQEVS